MTGAFRLGASSRSTARLPRPLPDRIRSVGFAAMAYWFYRWDWGETIALDGLDAAATMIDEPIFSNWVDREVDDWLDDLAQTDGTVMGPLGAAVRRLSTTNSAARSRLYAFADMLRDRDQQGMLAFEDHTDSIFVDSLYGLPAALVGLAVERGDDTMITDVLARADRHCELLQDPETGLFAHFATTGSDKPRREDDGISWGRGVGWAALGLADLLAANPPELPAGLVDRYRLLIKGLLAHEVPGGGWRNLIDEPSSYPESSTTALVVASLATARTVLDLGADAEAAMHRGWSALAHRIDASGHIVGVSYRPGLNTDPVRYEHAPTIGAYPWGQGPWLRAAATLDGP